MGEILLVYLLKSIPFGAYTSSYTYNYTTIESNSDDGYKAGYCCTGIRHSSGFHVGQFKLNNSTYTSTPTSTYNDTVNVLISLNQLHTNTYNYPKDNKITN